MNYAGTAFALNLGYLLVALFVIYGASRFLNWHNGVKFGPHVLSKVHSSPMASALYYGLRWIGICYLAGKLVGA